MANRRDRAWAVELCETYVAALSASDTEAIHRVFAPGSTIVSPVYGYLDYGDFYKRLFADTRSSSVALVSSFLGTDAAELAALLQYDWTLVGGAEYRFRCMDVFTLSEEDRRFSKLEIFYDASAAKEALAVPSDDLRLPN